MFRKTAIRSALAIGLIMTSLTCSASAEEPATGGGTKAFFRHPILLGAHRGGARVVPENTVAGFVETAKRWPGILLEADAGLTADGHVVLRHDDTVDRTTDGTGEIGTLTLEEIKKLDAGYRFTRDDGATYPYRGKGVTVATLGEVLDALPDAHFLVEFKRHAGIVDAVIGAIKKAGAEDRVLLASFVPESMDRARELAPGMATCYDYLNGQRMLDALRNGDWAAYKPEADVLSLSRGMVKRFELTPEDIKAVQKKGVKVQIHTINEPDDMRYWLDVGLDSILTDRPDLLAKAIEDWKRSR